MMPQKQVMKYKLCIFYFQVYCSERKVRVNGIFLVVPKVMGVHRNASAALRWLEVRGKAMTAGTPKGSVSASTSISFQH